MHACKVHILWKTLTDVEHMTNKVAKAIGNPPPESLMQVETIHAVLEGMKEKLVKVQQAVMQQLHQYRHLTAPPEAQRSNSDADGDNEASTSTKALSPPDLVDVGTGAAEQCDQHTREAAAVKEEKVSNEEAGNAWKSQAERLSATESNSLQTLRLSSDAGYTSPLPLGHAPDDFPDAGE